jgi:transcriptional regulator with GAF, ATPase, and Fis domain
MYSRRAWLCFRGLDFACQSEIRERLAECGLDLIGLQGKHPQGNGVLSFRSADDDLFRVLENARGGGRVVALSASEEATPPELTWELLHSGASDVLHWNRGKAAVQIAARFDRWSMVDELVDPELEEGALRSQSRAFRMLVRNVVEAARFTTTPILLTGESGTGKELLARLIHQVSRRDERKPDQPVTVDCSTIVPELSGSELFGHERGAFTGAHAQREGAFALANGSTLFLDEIGELPLTLQTQLLRAIQEKTYKRVGGNVWHPTDFRLVCATNRDLAELVRRGQFRLDLYHRIAGWVFHMLPLRQRKEDTVPLASHFLNGIFSGEAPEIDSAVREFLIGREYSGNVRELRQLVQRIAHRHVGPGPITVGDIPEEDRPATGKMRRAWPDEQLDRSIADAVALGASLKEIHQAAAETAIRMAVRSERGNLQRAARRLGVTDRALQMRRASGRI